MAQELNYVIRKAKKDDCAQILAMTRETAACQRMEDQVYVDLETLEREGFGEHPNIHYLVVETTDEQKLIGFALYYYAFCSMRGRSLHLEDIFVTRAFRKKGIASALIKRTSSIALASGCKEVGLACIEWNKPAMSLYKSLGAKNLTEIEHWHILRFDAEEMKNMTNAS